MIHRLYGADAPGRRIGLPIDLTIKNNRH